MDYNHSDIQAYLQNLPPVIQKCIGSAEWKVKIMEIGKKYSLQPAQIKNLEMETLLVAIGVESDQEMVENIKRELDISDILAEQLVEDVNQRVYKWIYKQWSSEEGVKTEENTFKTVSSTPNPASIHPLDIPPPNLPGEVIEESAEEKVSEAIPTTPTATMLRDEVKDFFAQPTQQENLTSPVTPISQQSTFTPPMEQPFVPQSPRSFITQKLTQPSTLSTPAVDIPKTYSVDPYREPIE